MKYILVIIAILIASCAIIIPNYKEPSGCSIGYKIPGCDPKDPKSIPLSER